MSNKTQSNLTNLLLSELWYPPMGIYLCVGQQGGGEQPQALVKNMRTYFFTLLIITVLCKININQ